MKGLRFEIKGPRFKDWSLGFRSESKGFVERG